MRQPLQGGVWGGSRANPVSPPTPPGQHGHREGCRSPLCQPHARRHLPHTLIPGGGPSEPTLFPRLRVRFADFPNAAFHPKPRGCSPWSPDAVVGTGAHTFHPRPRGTPCPPEEAALTELSNGRAPFHTQGPARLFCFCLFLELTSPSPPPPQGCVQEHLNARFVSYFFFGGGVKCCLVRALVRGNTSLYPAQDPSDLQGRGVRGKVVRPSLQGGGQDCPPFAVKVIDKPPSRRFSRASGRASAPN